MNNKVSAFIKENKKDRLEFYKKEMNLQSILDIQFSVADPEGNLYVYEDDIRIQMDKSQITESAFNPRNRSRMLAIKHPVLVKEVDEENRIVYVSRTLAKETVREELTNSIDKALENNETFQVNSKVMFVKGEAGKSYALVDLGGVGLTGVIRMKEWSSAYTSDLHAVAKHGDIVKVAVMKKILWNGKPAYSCSRKEAIEGNPWKGLNDKLPKGTIVNLTCISRNTNNFFGKIDGIGEINALCYYPEPEKNIEIIENGLYQGYIHKVNEEKKLLVVRISNKLS